MVLHTPFICKSLGWLLLGWVRRVQSYFHAQQVPKYWNPRYRYHSLWVNINVSLEKYSIHPFIHPLTHSQTFIEYLLWSGSHSTNREHKDIRRHKLMSIFNYSEGLVIGWAKCHLTWSTALKNKKKSMWWELYSGWLWPRTWGFPLFPAANLGIWFHVTGASCQCLSFLHPRPLHCRNTELGRGC